jgi:hypothetical protein
LHVAAAATPAGALQARGKVLLIFFRDLLDLPLNLLLDRSLLYSLSAPLLPQRCGLAGSSLASLTSLVMPGLSLAALRLLALLSLALGGDALNILVVLPGILRQRCEGAGSQKQDSQTAGGRQLAHGHCASPVVATSRFAESIVELDQRFKRFPT